MDELVVILDCDFKDINTKKIISLDKIASDVQNLVKNRKNLFQETSQENYISIEEIKEYCEKINDFFALIQDIQFRIERNDLQFSDLDIKNNTIDSLKKLNDYVKKTKFMSYDNNTLYQDVFNALANYDKMKNSTNLLDIIKKVDILNQLFLVNKSVDHGNKTIDIVDDLNNILTTLKKQNEYHKTKFLNNIFFSNFYLICGLCASYTNKTDISVKKMDTDYLKRLHDKMEDMTKPPAPAKDAINMTPIAQFIAAQIENLKREIKPKIFNLYEKK